MNQALSIRLADAEDAESLIMLNHEFNGIQMPIEEVQVGLTNANELIVLALWAGRPVGFACAQVYKSFCYREPGSEITEMYVREEARQKGVASSLLSFLEDALRARGIRDTTVTTGRHNDIAIKVYKTNGYRAKEYQVLHKNL